jgi:hypothetical protein
MKCLKAKIEMYQVPVQFSQLTFSITSSFALKRLIVHSNVNERRKKMKM